MTRRLRPLRTQRRVRFRLTLPTIILPVVALVLLARGDSLRIPFDEREASLAIAAHSSRGHLAQIPAEERTGAWTTTTIALASVAPRVLTSGEFHMRLPGLFAGCAALAAAIILGERLFATRIGLVAALLLLALPPSRGLLGTRLGGEPWFLVAMLASLAALRDVGDSRAAAVVAGIAAGIAIAAGGADGAWLPVMALAWLWSNRGLTIRSSGAVVTGTVLATALATFAAQAWLLRGAGRVAAYPLQGFAPQLAGAMASPTELGRTLLPVLPFVLTGLVFRPARWSADPSLRFVLLWLASALGSFAVTGAMAPAYVAVVFLVAMLAVWGWESARWKTRIAIAAASVLLLAFVLHVSPRPRADEELDRWAVRETGRFVRRMVPPDREVAAAPDALTRLAYYARRPVGSVTAGTLPDSGADYVILSKADLAAGTRSAQHATSGAAPTSRARPRVIAQFGPWVIARFGPAPERPSERPSPEPTASLFLRPGD